MYNSLFRSAPYKFLTDDRFRAANYACRFRPLPAATDAYNTDINVDRLGGLGYPEAIVTATYNIISECVVRERNVLFYCRDGDDGNFRKQLFKKGQLDGMFNEMKSKWFSN